MRKAESRLRSGRTRARANALRGPWLSGGCTAWLLGLVMTCWLRVAGTAFDAELTERALACVAWQALLQDREWVARCPTVEQLLAARSDELPRLYRWMASSYRFEVEPYCQTHDQWGGAIARRCRRGAPELLEVTFESAGEDQRWRTADDLSAEVEVFVGVARR